MHAYLNSETVEVKNFQSHFISPRLNFNNQTIIYVCIVNIAIYQKDLRMSFNPV